MTTPEVVNQGLLEMCRDMVTKLTELREQWDSVRSEWDGYRTMATEEIERLNRCLAFANQLVEDKNAEIKRLTEERDHAVDKWLGPRED